MPNQNVPSFESDFDTPEFRESNLIPFELRRRIFKARRIPIGKLREYQAEAETARDAGDGIAILLGLFEWVLTPDDLAVFKGHLEDADNPLRLETIKGIVEYISTELAGSGDEDDAPKDDDSSPSLTDNGTQSTTSSPESSGLTLPASTSIDTSLS